MRLQFESDRNDLRQTAKEQILKVQAENCRTYNLRRRKLNKFIFGQLVAIKRTQTGPGLKLKTKFISPYKITKVKTNNTYDVEHVGGHAGLRQISTCTEYMKLWSIPCPGWMRDGWKCKDFI